MIGSLSGKNSQTHKLNSDLGQYFTPQELVARCNVITRNGGRWLEPSIGDGAFLSPMEQKSNSLVGVELDSSVITDDRVLNMDFLRTRFLKNSIPSWVILPTGHQKY